MWRIWQLFDPRWVLAGLAVFLLVLAVVIHLILLSTDRFNWLDGPHKAKKAAVEQSIMARLPVLSPSKQS
jgi:light-harvesting complex 1 alpha chain